jgi:hypothetical protein
MIIAVHAATKCVRGFLLGGIMVSIYGCSEGPWDVLSAFVFSPLEWFRTIKVSQIYSMMTLLPSCVTCLGNSCALLTHTNRECFSVYSPASRLNRALLMLCENLRGWKVVKEVRLW